MVVMMEWLLMVFLMEFFFLFPLSMADSQRVQDSIECGVAKLESTVDNLNVRLARLLAEYSASQAKLKQRIAKLEIR